MTSASLVACSSFPKPVNDYLTDVGSELKAVVVRAVSQVLLLAVKLLLESI